MAELDFYAFGVPYGYSSIQGKREHERYLEMFYSCIEKESGRKMVVKKNPNGTVFYSLLVYADKGKNFLDVNGRPGSFFGLSLVLTNQQFKDPTKVWTCLNNVYDESIKGNIVRDDELSKQYKVRDLGRPEVEKFVHAALQREFNKGLLRGEITDFKYNANDPTNNQVFRPVSRVQIPQNGIER